VLRKGFSLEEEERLLCKYASIELTQIASLPPISYPFNKRIRKRSQVSGFGFQVEGNSNNSDLIRTCRRICLAISTDSRAYSVAGSDECWLTEGISIFRRGWKKARNNSKPLNP